MKLAISNIAWPKGDDDLAARALEKYDVRGVEIAPTLVWSEPLAASDEDLVAYRRFWNERGIDVVALQALLYGRPELTLFASAEARERTLEHLVGMMRLGSRLGARVLVFGSPKNRRVGELDRAWARKLAVSFFRRAGEAAANEGVVLCIEPNPKDYGCDFITSSAEALSLVRDVSSEGFGLHLDAAAMTLAGERPGDALARCAEWVQHFHASEPFLRPLGSGGVAHADFASELDRRSYSHWVSVEMRYDPDADLASTLDRTLSYLQTCYRARGPASSDAGA